MSTIVNIDDLREQARRKLPKIFFDYIDGGGFSETTMRRNRDDFGRYELIQRALSTPDLPDLSTRFLGAGSALPFMIGPVGFLGLYRGRGEVLAARAAKAKGIPLCLSSFSIGGIETLRREAGGTLHFQLYMLRDRGFVEDVLQSARAAGVEVLHLTVDTAITSIREKDVRNGFRAVTRLNAPLLLSMMQRPGWCLDMLRTGSPQVEAVADNPDFGKGALEQAAKLSGQIDPALTWQDVAWLRARWPGQLVIKGILSPADAVTARDNGADAVVVSNHGGRQLDYARSTITVLPEVRAAVGDDFCVMVDGGFRRGTDIAIALALGASGVMLGRAYAFALAAGGQAGVEQAIDILTTELTITLKLMGVAGVDALRAGGDAHVRRRAE